MCCLQQSILNLFSSEILISGFLYQQKNCSSHLRWSFYLSLKFRTQNQGRHRKFIFENTFYPCLMTELKEVLQRKWKMRPFSSKRIVTYSIPNPCQLATLFFFLNSFSFACRIIKFYLMHTWGVSVVIHSILYIWQTTNDNNNGVTVRNVCLSTIYANWIFLIPFFHFFSPPNNVRSQTESQFFLIKNKHTFFAIKFMCLCPENCTQVESVLYRFNYYITWVIEIMN